MQPLTEVQRENKMGVGFQKTVTVMAYELGDLAKAIVYGHLDDGGDLVYRAEARVALADLITQCRVMGELLESPFSGLVGFGEERFMERVKECRDGVI